MKSHGPGPGDPYGEDVLISVERLKASPRMAAKCHDCAFAASGSPEQSDNKTWFAILRHVDRGEPFFCHQGMPVEDGAYVPPLFVDGAPVEGRVCAGWVEMRRRFLDVRRRDLDDDLRRLPAEQPFTFAVARAAIRLSHQTATREGRSAR